MNTFYVLLIAVGCLFIGIAIAKIAPIFADKKIDESEKEKLEKIVIDIIKKGLKLTTLVTEEDLIDYCIEEISDELKEQGITSFTSEEIEIAVRLGVKVVKNVIEK